MKKPNSTKRPPKVLQTEQPKPDVKPLSTEELEQINGGCQNNRMIF